MFYSLVVIFTLGAAAQITVQIFRGSGVAGPGGCREGLTSLAQSIARAREVSEGADGSAEEALVRFRAALSPAWAARDSIEQACRATGEAPLLEAFDTIERLRYAEESAVRRDVRDLVPLRRQVRALAGVLSQGGGGGEPRR